uniref:MFS domain-containing protein n=1 Tax=Panagrellus redivivus TaxID=6233 RepID=A0A7E4VMY7_PANRE
MGASVFPIPPPVNPSNRYGYKLNPQRWLIFTASVLLSFVVGLYSTTLSAAKLQPAINNKNSYFCPNGGDCAYLDSILDGIRIFVFLVTAYPTVWFHEKYELKKLFQVVSLCTSIGATLRIVVSIAVLPYVLRYVLIVMSQIIIAAAQPGVICTASGISQSWFPDYQRTIITSIILFSNIFGQLIPFAVLPALFGIFNNSEQAIFITIHTVPLIFIVLAYANVHVLRYSLPNYPPSASSTDSAQVVQRGHRFLREATFIIQVFMFASLYGGLKFMIMWNHSFLCPKGHHLFGYIGTHTGLLLLSGLAGNVIMALAMDKIRKYKKAYRLSYAFTTFGIAAMAWVLQVREHSLILLVATLSVGFFGIGSIGIMVETAMETVFPIHGIVVTGILFTAGELYYGLLSVIAFFTKKEVVLTDYAGHQCGLVEFWDYAFSVEIVSLSLFTGFIVCLVGLNARRRRHDYEVAAKLLGFRVLNTRYANAPLPSIHNDFDEEDKLPKPISNKVEIVLNDKK